MKILMLHDCAFVGYELTRELKKHGVTIKHIQYHNKLGFSLKKGVNIIKALIIIKKFKPDLIHANYLGLPSKMANFSGFPFLIHCHGSDVRKGLTKSQKRDIKKAEAILYATPDLKYCLPKTAIYLKTPVGPQFKNLKHERIFFNAYRPLKYEYQRYGPTFHKIEHTDYSEMPSLLNQVNTFHDRTTIKSLSKTALESLACGCNVLDYEKKWLRSLPEGHRVSEVAQELLKIYENILMKKILGG